MSWLFYQDQWALNHKCTFDGVNKLITIGPNTNLINVKKDIYSDWKEWVMLYNNAAFQPAVRVSGGDPIGGGAFTGDVYFLINGWQILIDHSCTIDGVVYSDDYPSPFVQVTGTQIVTNKVSSLVSVIAPTVNVSGLTVPTAAENAAAAWTYSNRTLTTSIPTPPTVAEIRSEMDTNSSKLSTLVTDTTLIKGYTDTLESSHTTLLNAVQNISVSSSAIHAPAISFTLNNGVVNAGSYLDTKSLNNAEHVIYDNAGTFSIEYMFDIGLNSIPSEVAFVGRAWENRETVHMYAWNYLTNTWDNILMIPGENQSVNHTYIAVLYSQYSGKTPGEIGDVKIKFDCNVVSDLRFYVDQLFVSYAAVAKEDGYSGHAVYATPTTIQLGSDAIATDNYYTPCLVTVNHGTGAQQYAKAISYNGTTKLLTLELPMAVTLDTTSHVTLSPWATANMPTSQYNTLVSNIPTANTIAAAVRTELTTELTYLMQIPTSGSLTTNQANMLLEMYELLGLDATKPLVVTTNSRTAGSISQNIATDSTHTIVTRV